MTHMDTVPLCAGAKPKVQGKRIVNERGERPPSAATTAPAARVLVTLAAELIAAEAAAPAADAAVHRARGERPVRREAPQPGGPRRPGDGLQLRRPQRRGRDHRRDRRGPLEGGHPRQGVARRVAPEQGISATMVLALAMAEVYAGGWFGKVVKDGQEGTSNVGPVGTLDGRSAGDATNVVTDFVHVEGREPQPRRQVRPRDHRGVTRRRSRDAASKVKDHEGRTAKVKFTSRLDYFPFRLKDDAPVVQAGGDGRAGHRPRAEPARHQRRARRQLDGQARHPDGDLSAPGRTRSTRSRSSSI